MSKQEQIIWTDIFHIWYVSNKRKPDGKKQYIVYTYLTSIIIIL